MIFRTARVLGRALVGKPIIGFRSTYPMLTRFDDDTPLVAQVVENVESRGKWLLIHFSVAQRWPRNRGRYFITRLSGLADNSIIN